MVTETRDDGVKRFLKVFLLQTLDVLMMMMTLYGV